MKADKPLIWGVQGNLKDMAKDKKILWNSKWKMLSTGKDRIGHGGQGIVRKAENLTTGEIGALKELIHFTSVERRKRMHIEAESLAVLQHPNICKLLDSDTKSEGRLYIVTEFIDGVTLEDKVAEGRFSLKEMQEFGKKLLSALHHAHSVSVFHRDIKPENIVLRKGDPTEPVLIDFGLSFNEEESLFSSATFHDQQLGNRFLHLPELQRGAREPRADLTQFCGILLFTLTGIIPISLIDGEGKYPHQVTKTREALDSAIEQKSAKFKLLRIFDKAFQLKLDNRWQTTIDLMNALEKVNMVQIDESEIFSIESIRQSLESDPDQEKQSITKSLYDNYMRHTSKVVTSIVKELPASVASTKQGGARCDLENAKFGSHFGITLPRFEVYLRINGVIVGDEVTMLIQDDETILCRLDVKAPDWEKYREILKEEYIKRMSTKIQGDKT